ncbi:MAG: ABC transporter permease, partial [Brooklawnia sp.]
MGSASRLALRGLIKLLLLVVAASMIMFALVAVSPIDPIAMNSGTTAYLNMSPEKRAQLAQYWGTELPVWERYLKWAGSFLQGDMGISLRYNQPVATV